MRIVLVTNTVFPDRAGGLPRYVRELASALIAAGPEVTILAKRVDARSATVETASDGVRIIRHRVPAKANPLFAAAYPLYAAAGVLRPLRRLGGPETIVHAHFPVTALPLAVANIRYLYTFHAPVWRELLDERQRSYVLPASAQRPAVAALRRAERLVVHRAARRFVLSKFMGDHLAELTADGAQLVPGGVDLERFRPGASTPRAPVSAPWLFTARRLTPRTGVDRLLAAMPHVLAKHSTAQLTIAGTGELAPALKALAARLGVHRRVRFLGRVDDDTLIDCYRRATLVVMPTAALEGFGLTAAEALACGTPVLGTPVGALPELLAPLDRALLAPGAGASELAAAITALLADPDRLASIAARCRSRVAPSLGWPAVASRYLTAYEETLTGAGSETGRALSRPRRGRA